MRFTSSASKMSKYLNLSSNPRLDYFTNETIQVVNKEGTIHKHYPINSLESSPITFNIFGNDYETLDFREHKLYVRCKITDEAGENVHDRWNDHYALVNNCLHSLFQHVSVEIGGVKVTPSTDIYPYRAMVETLLTNTVNSKHNLEKIGFYLDEGGGNPTGAVAANTGFAARAALARGSASMEFCGELLVDVFKQSKNIPTRTNLQIKLYPS